MHMESRYDALLEKHRRIEIELATEMKRPLPNAFVVQRLKRRKLLVKDEIDSWERLIGAARLRPVLRVGGPRA
jgi:hypothetical protein